jgi:hypothetical protein
MSVNKDDRVRLLLLATGLGSTGLNVLYRYGSVAVEQLEHLHRLRLYLSVANLTLNFEPFDRTSQGGALNS